MQRRIYTKIRSETGEMVLGDGGGFGGAGKTMKGDDVLEREPSSTRAIFIPVRDLSRACLCRCHLVDGGVEAFPVSHKDRRSLLQLFHHHHLHPPRPMLLGINKTRRICCTRVIRCTRRSGFASVHYILESDTEIKLLLMLLQLISRLLRGTNSLHLCG